MATSSPMNRVKKIKVIPKVIVKATAKLIPEGIAKTDRKLIFLKLIELEIINYLLLFDVPDI